MGRGRGIGDGSVGWIAFSEGERSHDRGEEIDSHGAAKHTERGRRSSLAMRRTGEFEI